jgi:hypothetical protein
MKEQLALVSIAIAFSVSAQADDLKQYAARTELYSITSLTLSDEQFLRGDAAAGKPVTVSGHLRIAQGPGRLPVVVLIHGSGGMGANIELWTREFNEMGVSTLRSMGSPDAG